MKDPEVWHDIVLGVVVLFGIGAIAVVSFWFLSNTKTAEAGAMDVREIGGAVGMVATPIVGLVSGAFGIAAARHANARTVELHKALLERDRNLAGQDAGPEPAGPSDVGMTDADR